MNPPNTSLRNFLTEGPFWLAMSSGFFGFYAHCGVLCALEEENILPSGAAGSSAGALIAGLWGSGLHGMKIRDSLFSLRRKDFWDPAIGFGLLKGKAFRGLLTDLMPVDSFEECRVPLSLSTFDLSTRKTRVFKSGKLVPAVHASCAVPFLFHPVWIGLRPLVDGGVSDRPGLAGVPTGKRVLMHHLASRSPWRIHRPEPPRRPNLVSLVVEDLPRVNPFRLERGKIAFEKARNATFRALKSPVVHGQVGL